MKKIILIVTLLLIPVFAHGLNDYYKIYPKDADELYLIALGALNTSGYQIMEIQTKNGYILFSDGKTYYLLTLTKRYRNQTEIKILPQNSDFTKGSEVPKSVFYLIDSRLSKSMELVK